MNNRVLSLTLLVCVALSQGERLPDPFCPYPSNEITRYPHSEDCTLYFECSEGTKSVQKCPDGLEFNAALEQCDTPEFSRCRATTPPHPHCINSTEVTYEPYPGDCTLYWECYYGFGYLYSCPEGLWWNQPFNRCDYPEWTTCDNSTDVTTQGTPSQPSCNGVGPGPEFYPYEGDCSKYWECVDGVAYLGECASGLWWHQANRECDIPGDYCGNWDVTSTTVGYIGPTPPGCVGESYFFAPYYPDCTKYWRCSNGELFLIQCPDGLWWHEELVECDYPGAYCHNSSITTQPTVSTPECEENVEGAWTYPYPEDCSKYWECVNGDLYLNDCPDTLWWNPDRRECDYPGPFCKERELN